MRKRRDLTSDPLVTVTQVNKRKITFEWIQTDPGSVFSSFTGPGWGQVQRSRLLSPIFARFNSFLRTLVFRMQSSREAAQAYANAYANANTQMSSRLVATIITIKQK